LHDCRAQLLGIGFAALVASSYGLRCQCRLIQQDAYPFGPGRAAGRHRRRSHPRL